VSDEEQICLVSERGCSGCAEVKKLLKRPLEDGEIKEIPIESELGKELDKDFKFKYVPACVIKDSSGKYRKCREGQIDELIEDEMNKS
jgi:hypothetical protein